MLGKNTRGFLIEFNDLALLKDVMPSLVDRDDVAVDDDHGMVVRGADFVRGLRVQDALPWLLPDYAS
jgi:hypothetical protein